MSARAALAAILSAVALVGCAGTRLRVTDASTGAAIAGARVVVEDLGGGELSTTTSNGDGVARVDLPRAARVVYVTADTYRLRGIDARTLPASGPGTVALQPAWLGAFMDGGVHRDFAPGESHDGTPPRCHCHDAR